jgi:hypothetical protein
MDSYLLDFKANKPTQPCTLESPLRMVLWAGDCVHDGKTDVERLPNFDIYVCSGFSDGLQENINFLKKRNRPGVICIIDAFHDDQMQNLINEFHDRISVIDADYHGNTPKLKPEYYRLLLASDGRAYNFEGINSMQLYLGDFKDTLEVFAPILPRELNDERRFTGQMVDLAKDNDLSVDMAWTSSDLMHRYYDSIREGQNKYSEYRKSINPNHNLAFTFTEERLEKYWSQISYNILNFKYDSALFHRASLDDVVGKYLDRFKNYLISAMESSIDNIEEFREMNYPLRKIQALFYNFKYGQTFSGFHCRVESYHDLRYESGPLVHGVCLRKLRIKKNDKLD